VLIAEVFRPLAPLGVAMEVGVVGAPTLTKENRRLEKVSSLFQTD
jgi:hypothetical protein